MIEGAIVAMINILAGVLILAFPGALRLLVGGYLLLAGIITLIFAFI